MNDSTKNDNPVTFQFHPIGLVHSCFKEKFGIPRQPGLVPEARATLELLAPYNRPECLAELEGFSHIWVVFVFHGVMQESWRPTVRPPRLGGNRRVGVFASRSPFRPNPVGLSVVSLEKIDCTGSGCLLHIRGADLLDGTPVLDIKPYIPYADAVPEAVGGFAADSPGREVSIIFSDVARAQCKAREQSGISGLQRLIEQILAHDPRPAYRAGDQQDGEQCFGMRLYDFDLQWRVENGRVEVLELRTEAPQ